MLNSRFSLSGERRFVLVLKSFSYGQKKVFFTAVAVLTITTIIMLVAVSQFFMVKVPAHGGMLIEGTLNTPAHINPLLAMGDVGSEADRDLSVLIYSGLLRSDGRNGFINDLAHAYEISPDGLIYTFTLKPELVWHDGKKLTARDIVFTIKTIQDSRIKSPKRVNWDGVSVEQIDDRTVRFILKKPYAPFLENVTIGILPEHIWKTIDYNRFATNAYNREPIGSGPYKFYKKETITKDGDEIPVSYTVKAFDSFALGKPYIDKIKFLFYPNNTELITAFRMGTIDAINSIAPESAKKLEKEGYRVLHVPLPRVLAVFFNQNQAPIFADISVRKALTLVVDRESVIDRVLYGYGIALDSAIPSSGLGFIKGPKREPEAVRFLMAQNILKKGGWVFGEKDKMWTKTTKKEVQILRFDLTTAEVPELKSVAEALKVSWDKLGVPVTIQVFSIGDLKETIVRPRKFSALFFGQVIGQGSDVYPFWHSSQRLDPMLNISSYINLTIDKILEKARIEIDSKKRALIYEEFQNEISKDTPALFMYAPEFLYVVPKKVKGISLESVSVSPDRFLRSYQWYIETDNVWRIFNKTIKQ